MYAIKALKKADIIARDEVKFKYFYFYLMIESRLILFYASAEYLSVRIVENIHF